MTDGRTDNQPARTGTMIYLGRDIVYQFPFISFIYWFLFAGFAAACLCDPSLSRWINVNAKRSTFLSNECQFHLLMVAAATATAAIFSNKYFFLLGRTFLFPFGFCQIERVGYLICCRPFSLLFLCVVFAKWRMNIIQRTNNREPFYFPIFLLFLVVVVVVVVFVVSRPFGAGWTSWGAARQLGISLHSHNKTGGGCGGSQ